MVLHITLSNVRLVIDKPYKFHHLDDRTSFLSVELIHRNLYIYTSLFTAAFTLCAAAATGHDVSRVPSNAHISKGA
jgi:hypothetical protein